MKQVDEMPTSGQFVAVWEDDSGLFSVTMLSDDGVLYVFDYNSCSFNYDIGKSILIPSYAKLFVSD